MDEREKFVGLYGAYVTYGMIEDCKKDIMRLKARLACGDEVNHLEQLALSVLKQTGQLD